LRSLHGQRQNQIAYNMKKHAQNLGGATLRIRRVPQWASSWANSQKLETGGTPRAHCPFYLLYPLRIAQLP
jgi:hypothetical protein